ncbi:MAG: hypothetical protein ACI9UA_005354, partial [Pseudoalteromonas tetraodonis]
NPKRGMNGSKMSFFMEWVGWAWMEIQCSNTAFWLFHWNKT